MRTLILSWLFFGLAQTSFAAIPAKDTKIEVERFNFAISEKGTNWELTPAPPEAASVKVLFRGRAGKDQKQPTLTVRTERLQEGEKDLKDYMKRWLREYPKFGYNVLGSKPFTLAGQPAYVVDVTSSTSGKQARQVITEKNGEVVLLTCLDEKEGFLKTLPQCNTIVKNFAWK